MMYNIRSDAIRWQLPDFLSDGNSNIDLSLTVCEMFAKQEKWRKLDPETEGQSQGVDERDLAIRLAMFDSILLIFFRILATRH